MFASRDLPSKDTGSKPQESRCVQTDRDAGTWVIIEAPFVPDQGDQGEKHTELTDASFCISLYTAKFHPGHTGSLELLSTEQEHCRTSNSFLIFSASHSTLPDFVEFTTCNLC